jgi:hypothetical protein
MLTPSLLLKHGGFIYLFFFSIGLNYYAWTMIVYI